MCVTAAMNEQIVCLSREMTLFAGTKCLISRLTAVFDLFSYNRIDFRTASVVGDSFATAAVHPLQEDVRTSTTSSYARAIIRFD